MFPPQDETFPELGVGVTEGCDDQESVCSSNEREGDAFPKAFDRDLVTPTNLQKSQADSAESASATADILTPKSPKSPRDDAKTKDSAPAAAGANTSTPKTENRLDANEMTRELRSLEERRRSLLDHHWAIPSKERSMDDDSVEEPADMLSTIPSTSSAAASANSSSVGNVTVSIASISIDNDDDHLSKQSCHDSGIDIRDTNLPTVNTAKKVYSDADIVLSSEWVPPITIAPTDATDTPPRNSAFGSLGSASLDHNFGRKKTSSVSFSVDDNGEGQSQHHHSTSSDKSSDKKNKMLKRLSYPLTWVEGLTGEVKQDSTESAPNTGDSNQSVFSKVFSR